MTGVFTIGHSTHALADFLALLRQHAVTAVADVRSAPYSRFYPHFNRDALCRELAMPTSPTSILAANSAAAAMI